jgi:hypothetical protein
MATMRARSLFKGAQLRFTHAKKSAKYEEVVGLRRKYLSPSLLTFEAFDTPLVLEKGRMQYMWDSEGNKYIDLLGQNLCISVGHCHPKVVKAAVDQLHKLPHCTTMYYHEEPANLAKELTERMPPHPSGEDWVVHLVNDGSEAVDLAIQMARVYTGRPEVIGLHKVRIFFSFLPFFYCNFLKDGLNNNNVTERKIPLKLASKKSTGLPRAAWICRCRHCDRQGHTACVRVYVLRHLAYHA